MGEFHRDRLPDPAEFFDAQGLALKGSRVWKQARCVFHEEAHPSLSVNVDTGAFRCFACGTAGGDIVAFYRQRTGASFVEAARALGAWQEAGR